MCKRNDNLDIAKGIAVLLMVLGHCIQYGNGNEFLQQQYYYNDIVYRSIYSFHMPLFAVIGGYLLSGSLKKKSIIDVLDSRVKSLGVPIVVWSLVNYIIEVLTYGRSEGIIGGLKQYFWTLMGTFWFLWAMLFCTVCVLFVHNICKDAVVVFVIVFILNMITPDGYNLNYFKFLYPFFAVGYLWKAKDIGKEMNEILISKKKVILGGVLFVIWLALLTQFKKEMFIYQSGFSLIGKENIGNQLFIDVFRILIGFCGSVCILLLTSCIRKTAIAAFFIKLGKQSLGIYIINNYVNLYILKIFCVNIIPNAVWIIALTCFITFVCLAISLLISKNKLLDKLLLGGR